MTNNKAGDGLKEPILERDSQVRDLFAPYRASQPVSIVWWLSEVGDQAQLRLIAGAVVATGLVRSDSRMMRAGARMLLSHELATGIKNFVKRRVDRVRPRSAPDKEKQKPRHGRKTQKEDTSFPSGHSAGAMAVSRAFSAEYPEHSGKALAAAGAVALAQIPRCAHYPSDIAAGLVIGAGAEAVTGLGWRVITKSA